MSTLGTLEAHLRTHPDDWPSWLVLSPAKRQALEAQIAALEQAHQDAWLQGYAALEGTMYEWQHGFVVGGWLPWEEGTLDKLAQLQAHAPLTQPELHDNHIGAAGRAALVQSVMLRGCRVLT